MQVLTIKYITVICASMKGSLRISEPACSITGTLRVDRVPVVSVAKIMFTVAGWLKCHLGVIEGTKYPKEVSNGIEFPCHPLSLHQSLWHGDTMVQLAGDASQYLLQAAILVCL